jgi:hypothetical protein
MTAAACANSIVGAAFLPAAHPTNKNFFATEIIPD